MATTVRLIKVHTPGQRTIEEVSKFLNVKPSDMLKSLLYTVPTGGTRRRSSMVVMRGDHELNEIKLARALGVGEVLPGDRGRREGRHRAPRSGFAGPVGFKGKVYIDHSAALVRNGVTGANETDHHLIERQPRPRLRRRGASTCGSRRAAICARAATAAVSRPTRASRPGTSSSSAPTTRPRWARRSSTSSRRAEPVVMGCYGIGVSRLVATAVEQHHDDNGIALADGARAVPRARLHARQGSRSVTAAAKTLYEGLGAAASRCSGTTATSGPA